MKAALIRRIIYFMRKIFGALIALALLVVPAAASQKDPRLTNLFQRLKAAKNAGEAAAIEEAIWRAWMVVENNELANILMLSGAEALSRKDYPRALKEFDQLVKRVPDNAEVWNKRATLHYLMGNYSASMADIERTLALEPRHFGALSGLGLINLAYNREQTALKALEKALEIHPNLEGVKERVAELRKKLAGPAL